MVRKSIAKSEHRRTKVKTGCGTCRIRKVKCDEGRPHCQKCTTTGRKCDGYVTLFKHVLVADATTSSIGQNRSLNASTSGGDEPGDAEIRLLNQCLSIKTIFNVKLDCSEEARQILLEARTNPHLRHALISLKSLRSGFDVANDCTPSSRAYTTSVEDYGVEQYCIALGGMASQISHPPTSDEIKSALLCCQLFISIEQVRGDYVVMAQHMIKGLDIMHEHRARPTLDATGDLLAANSEQLPLLDSFIIRLFAAPCKFTDALAGNARDVNGRITELSNHVAQTHAAECRTLALAPDMRTQLVKIAHTALKFLDEVSQLTPKRNLSRQSARKTTVLQSLDSWVEAFNAVQIATFGSSPEPLSILFDRLFYLMVKIIMLETLDRSIAAQSSIAIEQKTLMALCARITQGVEEYYELTAKPVQDISASSDHLLA